MASQKQLLANKLNAKKSTGAKTPEGKRRSSLNAIKHGLTCEKHVAIGENKREFELLKLRVLRDFPVFDVKSEIYVRKIIQYEWSLRRYQLIETGIFSRESLDYNQSENITRKDYYLDSAEKLEQERLRRNREAYEKERSYIYWCDPFQPINQNKLGSSRIVKKWENKYY